MTRLIVVALLILSPAAAAQEDCTDPHSQCGHDEGIGNGTTVQTTVEGSSSRALALGFGLGAGDIGDCLVTTQLGVIIFHHQGSKSNPWCRWKVAQDLDQAGKRHDAARMRCTIKDIYEVYGKEGNAECIEVYTFAAPPPPPPDDERYAQQQEEIEYLREDNASIAGRLQELTERLEQRPATVPAQMQTQIRRQESDAERRRARAKEAYLKALEGSE